ncbi:MAG: iron(III) ABC transporter, periplasmic binding protein [Candidatus Syntrophoarchaeum caldarius]|uniref:Iron(III) ABC transporter, periplasmic binding protein n=1 Tax=Candidatus Syntropharchaeum caldarium TaxID=1838285 RepID=A0A1F2PCP5_9EURY|nr:MAG: iron(III) ABC transporter, periplasmic binding protein [Candidatus Syntrophoarchaeum caldarius]
MNLNKIGSLAMATLIVLASVTLLSIVPVSASGDFTLGIYGNANQDDTIDMRDVTKIARMICWLEDEVELADAKYDGNINVLDIIQTELVILGREKELTVLDSADRTVTVKEPVERVVPLHMRHAGTVCVLGADDKVVGVDSTVISRGRLFPELSTLPSIGTVRVPDLEQILMLNPDLIITFTNFPDPASLEDKLPDTVSVIRMDLSRADDIPREMKMLGYILGRVSVADDYIAWYDGYVDAVKERVSAIPAEERVNVFMEREKKTGKDPLVRWAYASGTGYTDLCAVAGGINIAEDYIDYHGDVETEWVVDQNPDVIIGLSYKGGYEVDDDTAMREYYEEIIGLPGFENVTAVKDDRVHIISGDFSIGAQLPIGIVTVAKWFYPDKFEDLDPDEIHEEFLTEFMQIEYDLDEWGVFVYPDI